MAVVLSISYPPSKPWFAFLGPLGHLPTIADPGPSRPIPAPEAYPEETSGTSMAWLHLWGRERIGSGPTFRPVIQKAGHILSMVLPLCRPARNTWRAGDMAYGGFEFWGRGYSASSPSPHTWVEHRPILSIWKRHVNLSKPILKTYCGHEFYVNCDAWRRVFICQYKTLLLMDWKNRSLSTLLATLLIFIDVSFSLPPPSPFLTQCSPSFHLVPSKISFCTSNQQPSSSHVCT